ncbi:F-box only protein 28 isoform X3 [Lucilia cuprina]|uniref:F-box only protein 28 isoform X3 n=1 Tax=Lucilia cuprina TaxID=7375 RepID=UPI001F06FC1E|nr:F-box only protein 28 isoform X3 [Lucilia cuprina]
MNIFDLPNVMLIEIFEYLSYDEVSKKRLVSRRQKQRMKNQVCRRFDQIAQQVLNGGFNKVIKQHSVSFKRIKALLPRRESERRNHCLARHADILTSIETRISMLSMTYTKYMDLNLCCFIPGRVLDEIFRILRLISKTNKPLRPHEVLQELRDISSMAIEHFDEKIANNLKKTFADSSKMCGGSGYCADTRRLAATSGLGFIGERLSGNSLKTTLNESEPVQSSLPSTSAGFLEHYQHPVGGCPEARTTMMYFKKLETEYKKGIVKMHRMQQVQNLQNKRLQQTLSSVAELNVQIVELKKRLEDVDAKNREISANIRHISGGEPTKAENVNATTANKIDSNNDAKDEKASTSPTTSSSVTMTSDNNSKKRRIDDDGQLLTKPIEDAIDKPEENCDLQVKKPKLQS